MKNVAARQTLVFTSDSPSFRWQQCRTQQCLAASTMLCVTNLDGAVHWTFMQCVEYLSSIFTCIFSDDPISFFGCLYATHPTNSNYIHKQHHLLKEPHCNNVNDDASQLYKWPLYQPQMEPACRDLVLKPPVTAIQKCIRHQDLSSTTRSKMCLVLLQSLWTQGVDIYYKKCACAWCWILISSTTPNTFSSSWKLVIHIMWD